MKDLSINTKWLSMLSEGAKARDLDCAKIMLKQGISSISVKQQSSRVPLETFEAFADELITTLDDEYMGLAEKTSATGQLSSYLKSGNQYPNCGTLTQMHRSILEPIRQQLPP